MPHRAPQARLGAHSLHPQRTAMSTSGGEEGRSGSQPGSAKGKKRVRFSAEHEVRMGCRRRRACAMPSGAPAATACSWQASPRLQQHSAPGQVREFQESPAEKRMRKATFDPMEELEGEGSRGRVALVVCVVMVAVVWILTRDCTAHSRLHPPSSAAPPTLQAPPTPPPPPHPGARPCPRRDAIGLPA